MTPFSPSCHPSRLRMDSTYLYPHLMHGFLDQQESAPQTASRLVFALLTRVPIAQTDTQTTLRVPSETDVIQLAAIGAGVNRR